MWFWYFSAVSSGLRMNNRALITSYIHIQCRINCILSCPIYSFSHLTKAAVPKWWILHPLEGIVEIAFGDRTIVPLPWSKSLHIERIYLDKQDLNKVCRGPCFGIRSRKDDRIRWMPLQLNPFISGYNQPSSLHLPHPIFCLLPSPTFSVVCLPLSLLLMYFIYYCVYIMLFLLLRALFRHCSRRLT